MDDNQQLFASSTFVDATSFLGANGFAGAVEGDQSRPRGRRRAARCGGGGGEVDGGARDPKKRRLSDEQVEMLELSFREERKLETGRKVRLAAELGLDPKQVAVWFQNRRARHKSELLEVELAKLKHSHAAAVLHKFHLDNEVLRLKEKLVVTEEEVRRLRSAGNHAASGDGSAATAGRGGGSSSSSFSTGATCSQQQLPDGGGAGDVGEDDDLMTMMYVADYADNSLAEWFSLYGLIM